MSASRMLDPLTYQRMFENTFARLETTTATERRRWRVPRAVRDNLLETRNDDGDRANAMAKERQGDGVTRRHPRKYKMCFFVWLLGHRRPNPHVHQAAEQAPPSQGGPAVEKASDMANNLRRTLLATVTSRCDGGREDPRPSPCLVLWGHAQRHRDEAKTLREMTTNSHEHSIPLGRTTNTSQDDPYQIRRTTVS